MASVQLLHTLLRGVFLIDARAYAAYGPRVMAMMQGVQAFDMGADAPKMPEPVAVSALQAGKKYNNYDEAPEGSISILPIKGALVKADDAECGIAGMESMQRWVKEAAAHPNIAAIILDIDSPGGSVDGTGELADAIQASAKPVYAYVNGLMASAGYWIGSAAKGGIYASHATAEIGSIGTAISFYDYTQYLEKEGIKQHYITAGKSEDKNADYFKALAGDYKPIIEGLLDPTNELFHAAVKSYRGDKLNMAGKEPLTGKVYVANRAMELGLIDGIMSMDELIKMASTAGTTNSGTSAAKQTSILNQKPNMKIKLNAAWAALLSFFAIAPAPGADSVEHDVENADWGSLNSKLAERNQLSADLAAANERVTALEASLKLEQDAHNALKAKTPATAAEKPEAPDDDMKTDPGDEQEDEITKEAYAMRRQAGIKD